MSGQMTVIKADIKGALAASRNLAALSGSFEYIQNQALVGLRRRLPVEARRDIQREYRIKASRINKHLGLKVSRQKFTLTGYFRGVGLRNFSARKVAAGVTYAVFKGVGRSLRPGAFIGTGIGSNAKHVFKRKEGAAKRLVKSGYNAGRKKQPLETQYGATPAQMLRKGERPARLAEFARGYLKKEIERLLDVYLNKPTGD